MTEAFRRNQVTAVLDFNDKLDKLLGSRVEARKASLAAEGNANQAAATVEANEGTVGSTESLSRTVQYGLVGNASQRSRETPSGYLVQWIKQHLRKAVASNVRFALDSDVPCTLHLRGSELTSSRTVGRQRPQQRQGDDLDLDSMEPQITVGSELGGKAAHDKHLAKNVDDGSIINGGLFSSSILSVDGFSLPPAARRGNDVSNLFFCPLFAPLIPKHFSIVFWSSDGKNSGETNDGICGANLDARRQSPSVPRTKLHSLCIRAGDNDIFHDSQAIDNKKPSTTGRSPGRNGDEDRRTALSDLLNTSLQGRPSRGQTLTTITFHTSPPTMLTLQRLLGLPASELGVFWSFGSLFSTNHRIMEVAKSGYSPRNRRKSSVIADSGAGNDAVTIGFVGSRRVSLDDRRMFVNAGIRFQSYSAIRVARADVTVKRLRLAAQTILPSLLSVPSSCDAILMNTPMAVFYGVEQAAEIASVVVARILDVGAEPLVARRDALRRVKMCVNEARQSINCLETSQSIITNNIQELQGVLAKTNSEISKVTAQLSNASEDYASYNRSEDQIMMKEDARSIMLRCDLIDSQLELAFEAYKKRLKAVSRNEWYLLAGIYASKPVPALFLELMKVLLELANLSLPTSPTRSPKKKNKNKVVQQISQEELQDPAVVAKKGRAILCSEGFPHKLCSINLASLTEAHFQSLKSLSSSLANSPAPSALTVLERHMKVRGKGANLAGVAKKLATTFAEVNEDETGEVLLAFDHLRCFLYVIELYLRSNERNAKNRTQALAMIKAVDDVMDRSASKFEEHRDYLENRRITLCNQTRLLETEINKSRRKLDACARTTESSATLFSALKGFGAFVDTELASVDEVINCLIGDVCVAAVTLARAGWLPESKQRECLVQLRDHLASLGVLCSNKSPYVLGCAVDRLQIRKWTRGGWGRDPSTINAISLTLLAPCHTLVVDPDGIAEKALVDVMPDGGYHLRSVAACRFSLPQLESWAQQIVAQDGGNAALWIIITDLQAGASEDLLGLLAADCTADMDTLTRNSDSEMTFPEEVSACLPLRVQVAPSLEMDGGKPAPGSVIALCRMKMFLLSSTYPTIEPAGSFRNAGASVLLPTKCMRNVTVVHWKVITTRSYGVLHPGEGLGLSEQDNCRQQPDELAMRMADVLCSSLSAQVAQSLRTSNEKVLQTTIALYESENEVVDVIHRYFIEERPETMSFFYIPGLIKLDAIPMGFLANDRLRKAFLSAYKERRRLSLQIECFKTVERDALAYRAAVGDTFSISSTFVRTCCSLIPKELLPPYALTPRAIAAKCLPHAITKASNEGKLRTIPDSLLTLRKLSVALRLFQRKAVLKIREFRRRTDRVESKGVGTMELSAAADRDSNPKPALMSDDQPEFQASSSEQKVGNSNHSRPGSFRDPQVVTSSQGHVDCDNDNQLSASHCSDALPLTEHSVELRRRQRTDSTVALDKVTRPLASTTLAPFAVPNASADAADPGVTRSSNRTMGLSARSRLETALDLCGLLVPVRGLFFKEMVSYLLRIVCPGFEWLVKLCIAITVSPLTTDGSSSSLAQLQLLLEVIYKSCGFSFDRFCFFKMTALPRKYFPGQPEDTRAATASVSAGSLLFLKRATTGVDKVEESVPISLASKSVVRNSPMTAWIERGDGPLDGLWVKNPTSFFNNASAVAASFFLPMMCDIPTDLIGCAAPHNFSPHSSEKSAPLFVNADGELTHSMFNDDFELERLYIEGVRILAPLGMGASGGLLGGAPPFSGDTLINRLGSRLEEVRSSSDGFESTSASTSNPAAGLEELVGVTFTRQLPTVSQMLRHETAKILADKDALRLEVMARGLGPRRLLDDANTLALQGPFQLEATASVKELSAVLEKHSAFSPIFRGFSQRLEDEEIASIVLAWKRSLIVSMGIDFSSVTDPSDLLRILLSMILPPKLRASGVPSTIQRSVSRMTAQNPKKVPLGWWVSGGRPSRLTVVQTALLAELILPDRGVGAMVLEAAMAWLRVTSLKMNNNSSQTLFSGAMMSIVQFTWEDLVLAGQSQLRKQIADEIAVAPRVDIESFNPSSSLLGELLSCQSDTSKFAYSQQIKASFDGTKSAIFLQDRRVPYQLGLFSQTVRDLFRQEGTSLSAATIINTTSYINSSSVPHSHSSVFSTHPLDSKQQLRIALGDLSRAIRNGSPAVKPVVEMVDISSPVGSTLLAHTILNVGAASHSWSYPTTVGSVAQRDDGSRAPELLPKQMSARFRSGDSDADTQKNNELLKSSGTSINPSRAASMEHQYDGDAGRSLVVAKGSNEMSTVGSHSQKAARMRIDSGGAQYSGSSASTKAVPAVLTGPWGTVSMTESSGQTQGYAPIQVVGEMTCNWLPRFRLADISKLHEQTTSNSAASQKAVRVQNSEPKVPAHPAVVDARSKFPGLPPTVKETVGILHENLESSLLALQIQLREARSSCSHASLSQRLMSLDSFHLRIVNAIVTIKRIVLYAEASDRENSNLRPHWYQSMEPLSLWQLLMLTVKAADTVSTLWSAEIEKMAVDALLKNKKFLTCVAACCNQLFPCPLDAVRDTPTPTSATLAVITAPTKKGKKTTAEKPSSISGADRVKADATLSRGREKRARMEAEDVVRRLLEQLRSPDLFGLRAGDGVDLGLDTAASTSPSRIRKATEVECLRTRSRIAHFCEVFLAALVLQKEQMSSAECSESAEKAISKTTDMLQEEEMIATKRKDRRATSPQRPHRDGNDVLEVTVGALPFADVVQCLVRWTLDFDESLGPEQLKQMIGVFDRAAHPL